MAKILIADTDPILRNGLKFYLTIALSMEVVEADSETMIHEMLAKATPDLLIVDSSIIDGHRFEVLRRIKSLYPTIAMILMGTGRDAHYAVRALRAGATAYVAMGAGTDELANAIRAVLAGDSYVSSEIADSLVSDLHNRRLGNQPHEKLSDREYEVFIQIAMGKTLREIADELNLSIKTVATHKRNIVAKSGLKTTSEMMLYAIRNNLLN